MFLLNQIGIITISIIVAVVLIIFIIVLCTILKSNKRKKVTKGYESNIVLYLGGKDNIISAEAKGSRLNLVLKDYALVDETKLKENGVTSIIKMTTKITLVIGTQSQEIANNINKK